MPDLDSVALSCAKKLSRVDSAGTTITDLETEIKAEIAETVRFYNRKASHISEFRGFEVATVASTTWYSSMDMTSGGGDQSEASRTAVDTNTIISFDYARENPGASGLNEPLKKISYLTFESLFEGSTPGGTPTYFTYYGGQIGIWPTPDAVYTLYFSGDVKPVVPTSGTDESVWFTEALEMIEAGACKRVCLNYLRDTERAMEFKAIEGDAWKMFQSETLTKSSSGKLRVHD